VTNANCNGTTYCQETFGESFTACTGGFCDAGFTAGNGGQRADSFCGLPEGCAAAGANIASCNFNWFAASNSGAGSADPGVTVHGGTLVLDLPAGAKGKYTINLDEVNTFIAVPGIPAHEISSASETGFVVNFVTGSCCHNLGDPLLAGCFDGCSNRSDCEIPSNIPFVFTPGGTCANPPTSDGCAECLIANRPGGCAGMHGCSGGFGQSRLRDTRLPRNAPECSHG
jgi:hypothetical protein